MIDDKGTTLKERRKRFYISNLQSYSYIFMEAYAESLYSDTNGMNNRPCAFNVASSKVCMKFFANM